MAADGNYMSRSGMHLYTCKNSVGGWCIGGTYFIHIAKKPLPEQIINTEKLLGWKWFDD